MRMGPRLETWIRKKDAAETAALRALYARYFPRANRALNPDDLSPARLRRISGFVEIHILHHTQTDNARFAQELTALPGLPMILPLSATRNMEIHLCGAWVAAQLNRLTAAGINTAPIENSIAAQIGLWRVLRNTELEDGMKAECWTDDIRRRQGSLGRYVAVDANAGSIGWVMAIEQSAATAFGTLSPTLQARVTDAAVFADPGAPQLQDYDNAHAFQDSP